MSEYDDLARRVAAIEERLNLEAGLRASMDRDLADVKVWTHHNTELIQAVRETQAEHGQRLTAIEVSLTEVRGGVTRIVGMLDRLIERDDDPDVP